MASNVILVPVDFEEASRKAVSLAQELAVGLGAEVVLVHVYAIPVYTYPGLGPMPAPFVYTEITDAAKTALEALAREVGVKRSLLREGDPASEILAAARDVGATMIVMGTHGRRGLSHLLLGSVAERIVRQSPIPVTTVRAPAASAAPSAPSAPPKSP